MTHDDASSSAVPLAGGVPLAGRELLADVRALLVDARETLRHHRDLGVVELSLGASVLADTSDLLAEQERRLQGCQRCKLGGSRKSIVFGSGNPRAGLVVIGEGPGAEEDQSGKPFVGPAGQLLTRMLDSIQLSRDEVYICNAVKCRPPGNRNPEPEELAACAPFLAAQLAALRPQVVLSLGAVATQSLLRTADPIGKLRGRVHALGRAALVPTFHPSFLLRAPGREYKRMAFEDLKLARQEYDQRRSR
jgi:DNA polymerase